MSSEKVNATSSLEQELKPEDYIFSDNESSYLLENMHKKGAAKPKEVVMVWKVDDEIHYHVTWQKRKRVIGTQVCPHHLAKRYLPQLLITFLESRITWRSATNMTASKSLELPSKTNS
ncbi:uncharacterized protein [Rhodnius prolixus]|uniref:uncharacterized protein n=1 Tax=Rhodnius prolixus TaxID=13249 RepID=UPI003D18CDE5